MMTPEEAKDAIVECVTTFQGCKATELSSKIPEVALEVGSEEFVRMVDELCATGRLVEVEYVIPSIPYRIKSFLLPPGSEVRLRPLDAPGEVMVVPTETAQRADFFEAMMRFQYGEGEESDQGFEDMKRIADA